MTISVPAARRGAPRARRAAVRRSWRAMSRCRSNSSRPRPRRWKRRLWEAIETLEPLGPRFVSVTYGAGGSTRERTHATVARIQRETRARRRRAPDLRRGDAGGDRRGRRGILGGRRAPYRRAARRSAGGGRDLRAASRRLCECRRAGRGAAASSTRSRFRSPPIPNAIPIRPIADADLDNLKRKIDAGATRAITQFFFDARGLLPLPRRGRGGGDHRRDRAGHPAGDQLRADAQVRRRCAAPTIPAWMGRLFEGLDDHPAARQLVAATVAAELCRKLYAGGVRSFHFYTLNRAELSYAICHLLGLRRRPARRCG